MRSVIIDTIRSYPAFPIGMRTGTQEVCFLKSSRTIKDFFQCSNAYTGYGPNCLATFWTQLTYRFNGRTAQPLGPPTAPGCDEPTSRCQTFPSIWSLGEDKPVIPRVTFIKLAMSLPHGTIGSLRQAFTLTRLFCLVIKFTSIFILEGWFPNSLRESLYTSVTF
jgi:hypothetical protein